MHLTHARRALVGHTDQRIGFTHAARQRTTGMTSQGHHHHVALVGGLHRIQQTGFIAGNGNHQQHIASLAQRTHLPRQIVVGQTGRARNGSQIAAVRGQCHRCQLRPITLEAADAQACKHLCLAGRCPRAAGQNLAAAGDAGNQRLNGRGNGQTQRLCGLVLQVRAVDEMLLNLLIKHGVVMITVGFLGFCSVQ